MLTLSNMKTTFSIKAPDEVLATLTLTASVGEFRKLKELLAESDKRFNWPLGGLYKGVQQVVEDAEAQFTSEQTKEIT